jgi:dihydrofolate reductase
MEYLKKCFKKSTKLVDRLIDDEVVIVPVSSKTLQQDCIYNLDVMGSRIWQLIDGKKTVAKIRDCIVEATDAPLKQAENDLIEFVKDLENIGAIEETDKDA